jgi:hypothetical protein
MIRVRESHLQTLANPRELEIMASSAETAFMVSGRNQQNKRQRRTAIRNVRHIANAIIRLLEHKAPREIACPVEVYR